MSFAAFLALIAAFLTAAATIFVRQGLRTSDPYTGVWISMIVGVVGLWICVLVTGGVGEVSPRSLALFAAAGLIGTLGGRLTRFLAIEKVGAAVSAAVGSLTPLIASLLAILLLGERVTLPILAGTVVIAIGTVLLSTSGRRLGFRPWQIVLPLTSATCFGVVAVIRKVGLSDMGPVLGTTINLTAALIAFSALMLASGHRGIYACRGRPLVHFIFAGLTENTGVLLTIVALTSGAVSVVTPLTATTPIFVLMLSHFFLRGVEVLTTRVVAGTVLIVLGVYVITALAGW
ncbi:MAG: EamA family transporter [Burkholderiales bacterium]|nr:EamA family transporter [Burkholderiales bacterium]